MPNALQRWLWKGTFPIDAPRLDVLDGASVETLDIVAAHESMVSRLEQTVEVLETALRRSRNVRTAEAAATPAEDAPDYREFALSVLPALDALDRILDGGEESELREDEKFRNWLLSVGALKLRLIKILEAIGLSPIASVGNEVDLEIHDVVSVVPAGENPPNTVVAERQSGYRFRGQHLRDAKVIVAQ